MGRASHHSTTDPAPQRLSTMPATASLSHGEDAGETLLPTEIRDEGVSAAQKEPAGAAARRGQTPPRSPIRKLAGSLLGAFGRKKGQAAPADDVGSPARANDGENEDDEPQGRPGARAHGELRPRDDGGARSPHNRFTGAFSAALQSLSPLQHARNHTITLGLKWEDVGPDKPEGTELSNQALAWCLRDTREFSRKEWEKFQIPALTPDCYIKVGEHYFKPAADASRRDADDKDAEGGGKTKS
jgi:hypothetical protein